jgi:phytoene synthase
MVASPGAVPAQLAGAYAACERRARSHYENFPVASRLLPPRMRPHVAALYAFARTADDFADESDRAADERERLLDDWQRQLHSPAGAAPDSIFSAVHHTIDVCRLPVTLFDDLISAFRQDVRIKRYDTWANVLDYCRRSANPVGRLVLRIAGYEDPQLDRESDAVCTALQLTNFWQDLERDWSRGRLYVPQDDVTAAGARVEDLDARRWTPAWQSALQRAATRTRELFDDGRGIADRVRGRLRWELRLTWLGGVRILERLERDGFNVFDRRPTLSAADVPALFWETITWRSPHVRTHASNRAGAKTR